MLPDGGTSQPQRPSAVRMGIGYDSHRFAPGVPLILGGVQIPSDVGLAGHSDGDAIAHAVTDAILGAVAAGDIGEMFPDTDAVNKGRSSIEMLKLAANRVSALGWTITGIDVTVVAEFPRITPYRDAMRSALCGALHIEAGAVSIKGKTNEGMGWIGKREGLACIASATLVTR
jgi:2-C-methyl-D-erythritol 2,4-cyclodiphosphate synthase